MKKRWIILIIVVLLIGVGWYSFFVPHGGSRRAVAKYKEQLRAHGEIIDLASVQAAPRSGTNVAAQFRTLQAAWSHRGETYAASMRQIALGRAAVGHTNLDNSQLASYPTNRQFAAQLRGLLRGGKLDFNLNYPQGASLILPQLAEVKATEMSLAETALQALHDNDLAEAALDLNAGVDLLRAWGDEPLLISCLVRLSSIRIVVGVTWEALQHDGWTDAQLAGLQTNWEHLDIIGPLSLVFSGERAFAIAGMTEARQFKNGYELEGGAAPKFGDWIGKLMAEPKAALRETGAAYPKFWRWKNYWSYDEEYCGLQLATAGIDASRELVTNRLFVLIYSRLNLQSAGILAGFKTAANHFAFLNGKSLLGANDPVADMYRSTLRKAAVAESARQLLITAIALKRFQMRHGKMPEKLEELVPDFLPTLTLDFMDGQPLRYKPQPGGEYLLYSVGVDGKDDGGSPAAQAHEGALPPIGGRLPRGPLYRGIPLDFSRGRDIVWPQPATEEQARNQGMIPTANETNAPPALSPPVK